MGSQLVFITSPFDCYISYFLYPQQAVQLIRILHDGVNQTFIPEGSEPLLILFVLDVVVCHYMLLNTRRLRGSLRGSLVFQTYSSLPPFLPDGQDQPLQPVRTENLLEGSVCSLARVATVKSRAQFAGSNLYLKRRIVTAEDGADLLPSPKKML